MEGYQTTSSLRCYCILSHVFCLPSCLTACPYSNGLSTKSLPPSFCSSFSPSHASSSFMCVLFSKFVALICCSRASPPVVPAEKEGHGGGRRLRVKMLACVRAVQMRCRAAAAIRSGRAASVVRARTGSSPAEETTAHGWPPGRPGPRRTSCHGRRAAERMSAAAAVQCYGFSCCCMEAGELPGVLHTRLLQLT